MLSFDIYKYRLSFKRPFGLASGSRKGTDALFLRLKKDGISAWSEVSLPPYLNIQSDTVAHEAAHFLNYQTKGIPIVDWINVIHRSEAISKPARALLDIAWHDLIARMENISISTLLNIPAMQKANLTYTLSIADPGEMNAQIAEAPKAELYKIKLGSTQDFERIRIFQSVSAAPFFADVNQGWTIKGTAESGFEFLQKTGALFVEQAVPRGFEQEAYKLSTAFSIPHFLDESIHSIDDIERLSAFCQGVNIKLVKLGGLAPGLSAIKRAKELGLQTLLGCMSEGSCGTAAAFQLAGITDYIDLDGPLLISNDPFAAFHFSGKTMELTGNTGTGAECLPGQNFDIFAD